MIIKWNERISNQTTVLGEMLVTKNIITQTQRNEAVILNRKEHIRLGDALVKLGYVTEDQILETIAEAAGLPYLKKLDIKTIQEYGFDTALFSKFPSLFLDRVSIIPVNLDVEVVPGTTIQRWKLTIILSDVWQHNDIEELVFELEAALRKERETFGNEQLISGEDYEIEVEGILAKPNDIQMLLGELQAQSSFMSIHTVEDESHSAGKLFQDIMAKAIRMNASDVHISPMHARGGLLVRVRVDGEVEKLMRDARYTAQEYNMFLNKVLNLAQMNTTILREPQDGFINHQFERQIFELRIAVIPTNLMNTTLNGNKIQIRILRTSSGLGLSDLGLIGKNFETVREMYTRPSGIVLCAGPTGSGKTTTIYSILKNLDLEKQICYTIEDPIEYQLDGAYQIPVSEKEGRSFAAILRSLLRLDPDIVFMGEIRDPESAAIAVQIANTGHTVFSTTHTNSAYTTPLRLLSMGIPEYLLLGNLNGVIAQRLIRKNCPDCLATYQPNPKLLQLLGLPEDINYRRGSGRDSRGNICKTCGGKGVKGRIGIFEMLPLFKYDGWEDYTRSPQKMQEFFTERGHSDLFMDALEKLKNGMISPDNMHGVMTRTELMIENDLQTLS